MMCVMKKGYECSGNLLPGEGGKFKDAARMRRGKRGVRLGKTYAASYTVELALLTPLLLLTLVGSIYMVMHFHNHASLAVGACEIAVSGKADTELPPLLFSPPITPSVSSNASARIVRLDSFTRWHGGRQWEISCGATYETVRPVTVMNRIRAAKKAARTMGKKEEKTFLVTR